jgi:hypothetical protein
LRQAAGEPTAIGVPGTQVTERLNPLTALSATSAALALEVGEGKGNPRGSRSTTGRNPGFR